MGTRKMTVSHKIQASMLLVLCIMILGIASAEENPETGIKLRPGLRLQSGFGTEARYTDNMYQTSTNEVNGFGLLLSPAVALSYSLPSSNYTFGYRGEWGEFDTSSEDDYQDNEVYFQGDLALLARHRLELDASYKRGHDDFGTNRTQGSAFANQELDIWDRSNANFKYTFGGRDATLNLYVKGGVGGLEYRTNRTNVLVPSAGTRFLDHDTDTLGGGVVYKLSPKTSLLADLEHTNIDYKTDSAPTYDGDLERIRVGARWVATSKTTGEFWAGRYSRNFDSDARRDGSGFDWKARVLWNPRVNTVLSFETGKALSETYLLVAAPIFEDFISSQYVELGWRQDWDSRLHTNVSLGYAEDDYEGTARRDDRTTLATSLGYGLSRVWTAKAGVTVGERDSTFDTFDFDRNIIFVGLDGKF